MKISYRNHLKSRDWRMKRKLTQWLFHGKCPACGKKTPRPELHHIGKDAYEAMPHERPDQVIPFCSCCHACFEWAKRHRVEILAFVNAAQYRIDYLRVQLENVHEFYRQHVRDVNAMLDEAAARIETLRAMTAAGREWEEGRAA